MERENKGFDLPENIEVFWRMNSKEILEILKNEKEYLRSRYGLLSIGLFGSHAKNTEVPGSDIDLLVELKEPSFDCLAGIQIHLEKKLGKNIDLTRKREGMSERFLKRIQKDIQYV